MCMQEGRNEGAFFAAFVYMQMELHQWLCPQHYVSLTILVYFQNAHSGGLGLLYVSKRFVHVWVWRCELIAFQERDVHVWLYFTHLSVTLVSVQQGRWGKSVSGEEQNMVAVEFVYEGNMNALATHVYEGCMLNSRVRLCFLSGGRIHANMLPPEIHSVPNPTWHHQLQSSFSVLCPFLALSWDKAQEKWQIHRSLDKFRNSVWENE